MKETFAWHGAWNDIYVFETDDDEWDRLLETIKAPDYSKSNSVTTHEKCVACMNSKRCSRSLPMLDIMVGKKVRLTPENCSHLPFVEFDPALDSWSKAALGPEDI